MVYSWFNSNKFSSRLLIRLYWQKEFLFRAVNPVVVGSIPTLHAILVRLAHLVEHRKYSSPMILIYIGIKSSFKKVQGTGIRWLKSNLPDQLFYLYRGVVKRLTHQYFYTFRLFKYIEIIER